MNADLIFRISLFNTAIALIMLKLEIEDKDLENKKILFNLHSIENIIDNTDKITSHKKEVFNGNYKMNQGFNDLISAYFYVENKVLNKNK
jgi:hypothetical protein